MVDQNSIFSCKLSNPVAVTHLTGGQAPGQTTTVDRCNLKVAKYEDLSGIAFLAREVAIVCDRNRGQLRVLHVNPTKGDAVFLLQSSFTIERPSGVATLARLDATEPKQTPFAFVAVTERDLSTLLIIKITQGRLQRKPYSASRAVHIQLGGPVASLQLLTLRGGCGTSRGNVGFSVLRARREMELEAAAGEAVAAKAARDKYASDARPSSKVFVTRQGVSESSVIEVDVADVLSGTRIEGTTRRADGSEHCVISSRLVATLSSKASAITVDLHGDVYAVDRNGQQIKKCSRDAASGWEVSLYAGPGTPTPLARNQQPKDGHAVSSTFGEVVALAAWPCGRTLFGLDYSSSSLFKVANLDGFAEFASLWRSLYRCHGILDPLVEGDTPPTNWGEVLPIIERDSRRLDALHQQQCDALGLDHLQGNQMWMDTNSLRAQTQVSTSSMRAAYEYVYALDQAVAAKMDTQTVQEKVAELWFALVSWQPEATRSR